MRLLILPAPGWPFEKYYELLLLLPALILICYFIYWCFWYRRRANAPPGELMVMAPVVVSPYQGPAPPPIYAYSYSNPPPPVRTPSKSDEESLRRDDGVRKSTHSSHSGLSRSRELVEPNEINEKKPVNCQPPVAAIIV
ncbi:hypothetical protein COOONC_22155 [Cooperia oncophora]